VRAESGGPAVRLGQTAAVDSLDWNGFQIDPLEAAHVDPPQIRSGARATEREDPTIRAEVVCRPPCVKLIRGELFERGKQLKVQLLDSVDERSPSPADRTVANPHMIKFSLDFESYASTVTAS
jgi:hypothetical protein